MQLQHNTAITVANSDTLTDASQGISVFRVGASVAKSTSATGESAYLSFNANETKTIALPLGYSSANRARFVAECVGTLEITITHPTLAPQKITVKDGSIAFSMRIDSVSITEKAGASASMTWSFFQADSTNPEAFS
jgi:hypothetical protein